MKQLYHLNGGAYLIEIEERLELFRNLVLCNYDLYYWSYDRELNALYSNCPYEILFNQLFSLSSYKDYMFTYGQNNTEPLVLSDALGLVWITVFEKEKGLLNRIHVIGPAFTTDYSIVNLRKAIEIHNLSMTVKKDILQQLELLPVLSITHYFQYALMLHYCVTGEKIQISDLNYQIKEEKIPKNTPSNIPSAAHIGTWMTEQTLLKMVQDGNLNYKAALANAAVISSGVKICIGDPIRQAKDSVIVFTALCTRAAINGGLSPENAYTIGDYYTQNIEYCPTITEIATVSHTMYDDFIHRVHKRNSNPDISKSIQSCCDYIEMHIHEKLLIQNIAKRVGYTEYYLTKKFKKEIGCSINDYIKKVKIEQAKILLSSTQQGIQDISDSLNFCSRSYFSDTFQKIVGITPSNYRAKNLKL